MHKNNLKNRVLYQGKAISGHFHSDVAVFKTSLLVCMYVRMYNHSDYGRIYLIIFICCDARLLNG